MNFTARVDERAFQVIIMHIRQGDFLDGSDVLKIKAWRKITLAVCIPVLAAVFSAGPPNHKARAQARGAVITPASSYSDPAWRGKASRYQGSLAAVQSGLQRKFKPDRFRLLTTAESSVGGLGFWANPTQFGDPSRYLCVFAKVQLPPPSTGMPFPDTQTGRILTIMDAYGKETMYTVAKELQKINDPQVAGATMVFIFSKKPLNDPGFEQSAESLGLFMKTPDVLKFAKLQMTLQTLFSRSQMLPLLSGSEQIQTLRLYLFQP
jgi:hypothetical protein